MWSTLPEDIIRVISSYCSGIDEAQCMQVNSQMRHVFCDESLWQNLCCAFGIWQQGTRSRGRQLYRHIYAANTCLECHQPGEVKLDLSSTYRVIAGPLVSLCASCYRSVSSTRTMTERRKHCLLRLGKRKIMGNMRFRILAMIPERRKRKKHG